MHRYFFSLRIALIVTAAALVVASLDIWLNGFAVVADPDGQAARALLRSAEGDAPMRPIASGFWAGRPRDQATIVVVCNNGREVPGDPAVSGTRVRFTLAPHACAPVADSAARP